MKISSISTRYFLYGDWPPLPNPTIIDRTGLETRIIPWLEWVDGLLCFATTDWSPDPGPNPGVTTAPTGQQNRRQEVCGRK